MISIAAQFTNSGFEYDRIPGETNFALPNTLNEIKIQPNDLAVATTFNSKMSKLYDNFLYLYSLCFLSTLSINRDFKGKFSETTGFVPQNIRILPSQFNLTTPGLSSSSKAIAVDSGIPNLYHTIFASTSTLGVLTFSRVNERLGDQIIYSLQGQVDFIQSTIDPIAGSINFSNIGGITQKNNKLFVTDSNYNNIYSYNLADTFSDDNIKQNILFQLNIVGGKGSVNEKTKFDIPTHVITLGDNLILVVDTNNKCFKVFDENLSWVSTSVQAVFFNKYPKIKNIIFHAPTSSVFIITEYDLHIFSVANTQNIFLKQTVNVIKDKISKNELIDIKIANYDNNIIYILSKNKLIKKWVTKIDKSIAITGPRDTGISFNWLALTPVTKSVDLLLLCVNQGINSYITVIEDSINYKSLLKINSFDVYSKEEVFIKKGEYVSSWIFNKSLKKMLFNLSTLVSNIAFRFFVRENEDENDYIYSAYNTIVLDRKINDTNRYANIFINENFQSETINRCFEQLYEYQLYILTQLINNEAVNVDLTPYRLQ